MGITSSVINKLAFIPPPAHYSHQQVTAWVRTKYGNKLPLMVITHRRSRFTIIFSHGNAEDLGTANYFCQWLSQTLQATVVSYDYSGYGLADGEPSEKNMYADIAAVFAYVRDVMETPTHDIVLYGKSLGSCPTTDLASRQMVRGAMIISPLASGARVLFPNSHNYVLDQIFAPNVRKVDKIEAPVLIVHGSDDEVISISNGIAMFGKLQERGAKTGQSCFAQWVEGAHHNDLEERQEYHWAICKFAEYITGGDAG